MSYIHIFISQELATFKDFDQDFLGPVYVPYAYKSLWYYIMFF